MGAVKQVLADRQLNDREGHNSRLFVDLCENIHIHFREYRLIFSLDEYFEFVHDLPIEEMLRPDPRLDGMLESLDEEKAIFTNATVEHARRVLRALGVERHFGSLIGIEELDFFPKPDIRAYEKALSLVGAQASECVLVDDRVRNLTPGRLLGMTTILVGGRVREDGADYAIEEVVELGGAMETIRSREGSHQ